MNIRNMYYDPTNNEVSPLNPNQLSSREEKIFSSRSGRTSKNNLVSSLSIFFILMWISFALFLIFFVLRLDKNINMSYIMLFTPLFFGITLLNIYLNLYLNEVTLNYLQLAKFFVLFTLNCAFFLVIIFLVLLVAKMEVVLNLTNYSLVLVPIYAIYIITFIFLCFVFPGLLDKDLAMYREAFFITCYYLASLLTIVLLNLKIDCNIGFSFMMIFAGLFGVFGLQMAFLMKDLVNYGFLNKILDVLHLFLVMLFFVGLALKLDGLLKAEWIFVAIPAVFLFLYYLAYSTGVLVTFSKSERSEV